MKQTKEGPITEPLCNFAAQVKEEIILDDGVETNRVFLIEGSLQAGAPLPAVRVPAARFGGMNWITEQWGLRAVLRAGQANRDYLREAIQRLSPNAKSRRVFTHSGWRKIDGAWVFLTSGGALGREDVEVDLGPELSRYSLPRKPEDPIAAMKTSLELLKIAPLKITAPLWAGIYRAPLASALPSDLSILVEGVTGALKSTLVALFLSHFGEFDRTHLPGAWASTANQLERRAFILKDVVFVVDDYAPATLDRRDLEIKAARLLRSQGNLAGRGRLRSDLTDRAAFPPRGLIISTGEQHPPGQSLLARTLIVEIQPGDVEMPALTKAQALTGQLPHAMTGYLKWLAPQLDKMPPLLRETFTGARSRAMSDGRHLRIPEVLAHLWVGLHCGLTYAEEIKACSNEEAEDLRESCWKTFLVLGDAQAQFVEEERSSLRFLRVLSALILQERGTLLEKDHYGSDATKAVGFVGWYDVEALYLVPEAAFRAIAEFCREAGEPFSTRQQRIKKDLFEEKISECDPDRLTMTAKIGGRTRRVLKLRIADIERVLGEQFPVMAGHQSHHSHRFMEEERP
jgi:hypothetical protein